MEYNILPLFSSPLFNTRIDVKNRPSWDSVKWASDPTRDFSEHDDILDRPEWTNIRSQIDSALQHFFYNIMLADPDIKINVSISWLNRNEAGHKHVLHWHPNSVFSGCLYFDSHNSGIILKSTDYPQIHWGRKDWNMLNSQEWTIKPEPGLLLIWPSHVQHEVQELNVGDPTRYSLAFNTWLTGDIWRGRQMSLKL